jgi:hypothetical protein
LSYKIELQKDQLQDEMTQKKNEKGPAKHGWSAFSVYQTNSFSKN